MSRLFLLDGTALAYRSHFALARSGLTTPEGRPIGATYGFTMTLRRILKVEKPDRIAIAFDPRGKTFRHETYPEYKGTRQKAPEEMTSQFDELRAVAAATCEHCGGRRRLIALITDTLVARRILRHLGLPSEAPPLAAARAPPQMAFEF